MIKNDWFDKEIKSIQQEMKETKRQKSRGDQLFPYLMIMLVFLLLANLPNFLHSNQNSCCPYCNEDITEFSSSYNMGWVFPNTWTCPNYKCGYENYEGIEYCALCGTRRK